MHVFGEYGWFDADVMDVVELSDEVVPVVWSRESMRFVDLWTEMTEDDDCWLVWTKEKERMRISKFSIIS